MKLFDQNPWARYVFAILSVATALLLRYSLTPVLGFDAPLLIFTLSVAVSALFGGFGAGLTATVLSMILGDYFFIKGTAFIPEKTSDLARLGLFAIVGILISYLSHLRFHAVRATAEARTALQESETALSRNQAKLLESERVAREEAEERWREAEMLQNVSRRLVATLDSEKIFSIICRAARDLTGAAGAAFISREDDEVFYACENADSPLFEGRRFPVESSIVGTSLLERRTIVIEDVDERASSEDYRSTFVKSMAVTPVDFDEPVGAIGIYWAKHHRPGKDEMTLLQSLAGLADLALANARSYEETLRARSQAEHANRLKDEFLATVSHELRSPLNAVLGWAGMLRDSRKLSDEQRQNALNIIERNSKALSRLVEDLLDVSRIISGKLRLDVRPLNLSEVLDQTIENIRTAAEAKRIKIKVTNDFPKAIVVADAERIQQIVFNLLSNAIKFTDEGGRVDIFVKQVDSSYEIEVKDTGRGISADFLPYVFDRFRQAERLTVGPRAGLGLGLAIVKSLVEAHGGQIRAESEGEGKGSAFTIAMPVAVQQPAILETALPAPPPALDQSLEGLRILVVDDDPDACDVVKAVLEENGAVVYTSPSAAEAVEIYQKINPDILIADIIMPEENGYDFIRRIRSLERRQGRQETPALALTAKAQVEDRLEALTAGFQMHVSKPVAPVELGTIVCSLAGRNQIH